MSIAFDSKATGTSAGTIVLGTQTVVSSDHTILILVAGETGTGQLQSSPSYSGNAMTKVIAGTSGISAEAELWYLLNPPTGAGTLTGTFTGAIARIDIVTVAYSGVDQTTPLAGSVTANAGNAATSGSITRAIGVNNWFAGGGHFRNAPGTTAIGNERGTASSAASGEAMAADSTGGTLQWTFSAGSVVMVGVELNAFAATNPRYPAIPVIGI